MTSRLLFVLLLLPWSMRAQNSRAMPRDSQTVVFVCEHGTVKSVVAFAYFNQLARARHLSIRAVSRGTDLESVVPAFVRNGLLHDGLAIGPFKPTHRSIG